MEIDAKYEQQFKKVMARLRGSDFFSLEPGEQVLITILSDLEDLQEIKVHKIKDKGRVLCQREQGQDCPFCNEGVPDQRGLGLGLFNHGVDTPQIIWWSKWKMSPLNDIEDAFRMHRVPVRGMVFSILRRGKDKDTIYKLEYKGHEEREEPAPSREQIVDVLSQVFALRDRKREDAE